MTKSKSNLLLFFVFLLAGMSSCLKETVLPVKASFEHQIEGEHQTTPVVISITNTTTEWRCEGGDIADARADETTIRFMNPGTGYGRMAVECTRPSGAVDLV